MRRLRASLARAKHVVERVQADRPGLRWDPNGVVEPELDVAGATARLHLGPHPDDPDRRGPQPCVERGLRARGPLG